MAHLVPILSKILLIYCYYADVVCAVLLQSWMVHSKNPPDSASSHISKRVERMIKKMSLKQTRAINFANKATRQHEKCRRIALDTWLSFNLIVRFFSFSHSFVSLPNHDIDSFRDFNAKDLFILRTFLSRWKSKSSA